jgi:hypothetical protein
MSVDPIASTPTDRATSDPAPLVPTDVPAASVPAAPVPAAPVTIGEIAEFLRHLTELRTSPGGGDPDQRSAFFARKAELFTRLATDPSIPPAPERRTS